MAFVYVLNRLVSKIGQSTPKSKCAPKRCAQHADFLTPHRAMMAPPHLDEFADYELMSQPPLTDSQEQVLQSYCPVADHSTHPCLSNPPPVETPLPAFTAAAECSAQLVIHTKGLAALQPAAPELELPRPPQATARTPVAKRTSRAKSKKSKSSKVGPTAKKQTAQKQKARATQATPTPTQSEHSSPGTKRKGPQEKLRQLVCILKVLMPNSCRYLPDGRGGCNRYTDPMIKAYLQVVLGKEPPHPPTGLPEGWSGYLAGELIDDPHSGALQCL